MNQTPADSRRARFLNHFYSVALSAGHWFASVGFLAFVTSTILIFTHNSFRDASLAAALTLMIAAQAGAIACLCAYFLRRPVLPSVGVIGFAGVLLLLTVQMIFFQSYGL